MRNLLIFQIILIVFSCSKTEKKFEEIGGFEKIDSIQVPISPTLIFQDLDLNSEKVLFLDKSDSSPKILLMDFKGNTKNTFPLTKETNFLFEDILIPFEFQADQSISAIGPKGLINYSFTGTSISTFIMPKNLIEQISKSTYFDISENNLILWNRDIVNLNNKDLSKFENICVLESINIANGESKPLIKIPNISIFRNDKYYIKGDWLPVFTVEKDEIHIIFGIEPNIYTFKKGHPNKLLKNTPIKLKAYRNFEGYDNYASTLSSINHPLSSGKILSIQKINKHFLITYFPGYDPINVNEKIRSKSTEELIEFMRICISAMTPVAK
ncbi:hypothetical protein Aoki45_40020 [Algoriphagus sp. oki45]|uniref:hypothetical protein n=1 Tax=Algoriphagus sp. oki45 TaxID=3067294 RepID=UPI0027E846EE|nr:hypothetical protein Aoki45_40020 [Algoriphagus sp. oki45]